jgi:hypothetical protein
VALLRIEAVAQIQALLKGLNRDADLLYEKWRTGHVAADTFQGISNDLRNKQLEALRILASVSSENLDRWDKIIDR